LANITGDMISTYISDWEIPNLSKVEDKELNELFQEVRAIDDRFLIQTIEYDHRTWLDKLMSNWKKTGVVYTLYNHTPRDTQVINFPPLHGTWSINTSVHKAQIMAFFYGFLAGKTLQEI
jgi:hypothetical protein